jgi:hypothetical protein
MPLDALPRPQIMPLRDPFFHFSSNITRPSFPQSMPRRTAVDECDYNFSNATKTSQMLPFCTPDLSDSYDVWWGALATSPLKTKDNLHYIQFLPHRDGCENVLCSTGKETFFLTNRLQSNRKRYWHRNAKLQSLAFNSEIMPHSKAVGCEATTEKPCAQNSATSHKRNIYRTVH